VTYEGYLNKWILPRWGEYPIVRINAGEVELWLRSLPLARASCAKIRNLMSVLFNHGIRYQICDRNTIQLVRQSAKRKAVPVVLTPIEVQRLLSALALREKTLVLVAFGTGLRMSELSVSWNEPQSAKDAPPPCWIHSGQKFRCDYCWPQYCLRIASHMDRKV
jgi:integrase